MYIYKRLLFFIKVHNIIVKSNKTFFIKVNIIVMSSQPSLKHILLYVRNIFMGT